MSVRGTVSELWRWPVKSMGGERVAALRVDRRGVAGDRTHALLDVHRGVERRLTARQAPRLLAWRARYDAADEALALDDPDAPVLTAPDGRELSWDDPDAAAVLAEDLGRPVRPHRDVAGQQDLADSVLLVTRATHAALEAELGRRLDPRRWRTNVLADLDAEPFAEEGWEGREVRVGNARFVCLHPCERCVIPTRDPATQVKDGALLKHLHAHHATRFGINLRALDDAVVREGDPVTVGT